MSAAEDISRDVIDITELRLDGGTQSRASLSEATIADYAEKYGEMTLPPIVVFYDGESHWLADGFHRVHGAKRAGRNLLPAEIHQGSQRDAILYSVGANSAHGLQRTNADKRRAVELLLRDEEWGKKADNWIAKACGVRHPFVAKVSRELESNSSWKRPAERLGQDGKTRSMPKRAESEPQPPSPADTLDGFDEPPPREAVPEDESPEREQPRTRPEMWWKCGKCSGEFNLESATNRGWVRRGHCDDCDFPAQEVSSIPVPSVASLKRIQESRNADDGLTSWVSLQKKLQQTIPSAEMRAAIFVLQGGDLALLRLGLSWSCTPEDLKRSFRDAARVAHPDRGGSAAEFADVQKSRALVAEFLGIE